MKKLILIVITACSLASCKKFLSERAQSDVIPETTEHFNEILFSDGYPERARIIQSWTVLLDDDVETYYTPVLSNNRMTVLVAPLFQWQANAPERTMALTTLYNFNTWITYYRMLLGTNVVIQFVDGAEGPESDKRRIKGEAFALRAFYHFQLVNLFAAPYNDSTTTPDKSPGIPLRTTADLSETFPARNSVLEVYGQIERDLDSALALLGDNKIVTDKKRINYLAVNLLASRVYLYEEKFDKAIRHADEVLKYQPGLMDLNSWGGMPDMVNRPLLGAMNVESIWVYGSDDERTPTFYAQAFDLSHDLVNTFEPSDLRGKTGFYVTPPELKPYIAPDFSQQKFGDGTREEYKYASSWRIAEVYLNRAEAYIQQYRMTGDAAAATQALSSLNTLRAYRFDRAQFQEWALQPADVLLRLCREERRRELYLEENHRWFDLRRYGMPPIQHIYRPDGNTTEIYRLEARDKQYVLPLTNQVLERNPALGQYPQISGNRMPK